MIQSPGCPNSEEAAGTRRLPHLPTQTSGVFLHARPRSQPYVVRSRYRFLQISSAFHLHPSVAILKSFARAHACACEDLDTPRDTVRAFEHRLRSADLWLEDSCLTEAAGDFLRTLFALRKQDLREDTRISYLICCRRVRGWRHVTPKPYIGRMKVAAVPRIGVEVPKRPN
jgi:hypothetical protein